MHEVIFNGCEVRIENSVTRVTVQHHKACRVMLNSYSQWLFLRQLHLNLNIYYFISNVRFSSYLRSWHQIISPKMTSKATSWHHARGHLTPPCIRQKYLERVKIAEKLVWYARKHFLDTVNHTEILIRYARKTFLRFSVGWNFLLKVKEVLNFKILLNLFFFNK